MSTTLPAKIEDYTPLQAQSTYTDAEKAAFKELHTYIQQRTKDSSLWYWDLGQKVAAVHRKAASKKELYGNKVLTRLAVGLGFKTDAQLRNSMNVCKAFGTKKAFTEYIKMQGEAGNMLSWSHLVYLAGVGDLDTRMQLAAACLEQAWTAEELWAKVRDLCERTKRGTNKPKVKVPQSARGCLTHVQSQAMKFNTNYDDAWTGDNFDLHKTIHEIPADKLNDKLLTAVRETKEQVVGMQTRAAAMAQVLAGTEADIEARMAAQAEMAEQNAAELEDAATESGEEPEDDSVALNEERNRKAREKRAAAKKKREAAKKRKGRVGVNR